MLRTLVRLWRALRLGYDPYYPQTEEKLKRLEDLRSLNGKGHD